MAGQNTVDLTGRVACVTGASSGLGRQASLALSAAGARVVAIARRADALQALCEQVGDGSISANFWCTCYH